MTDAREGRRPHRATTRRATASSTHRSRPPADDADDTADQPDVAARHCRPLIDWVIDIGVALLVAFLVRTFVLAHFVVDGASTSTPPERPSRRSAPLVACA